MANVIKENVVIIKTYDGENFELKTTFDNWLAQKQARIDQGKKSIVLKDYQYELFFSNIKSARGRTKHIEEQKKLEAPKPLYLMDSEEVTELKEKNPKKYWEMKEAEEKARAKIAPIIKEQLEKGAERRKKRFMESRAEDLKKLAAVEKSHGLETTISKLQEYEKLKKNKTLMDFMEQQKKEKILKLKEQEKGKHEQ